ncbi:MAG TPA: CbiX/SirB N-terminal domain-containing protein [Caldimonas sp.]
MLLAHGARDPRWSAPFEDVAERVRSAAPALPVRLAFLEFMPPTLIEAGASLVASGCDTVDVVPLFLGAGGHVRKDLPELLDRLRAEHPGVRWRLRQTIGEVDEVVEAMAQAALRLCAGAPRAPR